jgi:2-dehydro-3-deoxyphosphogluconate aldolase / (4S)-4-hydroxy-2-oxoglutarate aldolase
MNDVLARLGEIGLLPVIKIEREEQAVPLGRALLDGGLPCAEITLRTAAGEGAIRSIAAKIPEMLVGAGTVLSVEQAQRAVAAGARYLVSPGFDPEVVDWCLQQGVPVMPGVATPTEITTALKKGLRILKFFPAEQLGGVRMLKALADPFRDVKFVPTGGINPANLAEYLSLPNVHACGGSWMVPGKLLAQQQFSEIKQLVVQALSLVEQARLGNKD